MCRFGSHYKIFLFIMVIMVSETALTQPEGGRYHPEIDPNLFSIHIGNSWFELVPGTEFTYRSISREGTEINVVMVTDKTRVVLGVTTRVVWDRVWLNGKLTEETFDWYAEDVNGNVWYFGEDSRSYKDGRVYSHEGSWEAGVTGAKPGIIMKKNPKPGDHYRQEYLRGIAEDMGTVMGMRNSITVPVGSFTHCLRIKDWSPLKPDYFEYKYYSRDIGGLLLETSPDGKKRNELIAIR